MPFVSPILGEARANKPWLHEVPDPTTTVMWNAGVRSIRKPPEVGVQDDDVVSITSNEGTVEASVYMYPAIRPDTITMPLAGQCIWAIRSGTGVIGLSLSKATNEAAILLSLR